MESPDNPVLRTPAVTDPSSPNPQGRLRLSYGGFGGYVIELGNASEFVSTAAATDAALRIASDIIGSTLAHADELTRTGSNNSSATTGGYTSNPYNQYHTNAAINNQDTSSSSLTTSSGELSLNDLTLNTQLTRTTTTTPVATTTTAAVAATNAALSTSGGNIVGGSGGVNHLARERGSRELLGAAEDLLGATQRVIATADQPTIDLFEQTLNDFHALTLRNIVDSSDDDSQNEQQQQPSQHSSATTTGQRSNSSSSSTTTTNNLHTFNQENP